MASSGTASLEIALLQVPMVITYKLIAYNILLGRLIDQYAVYWFTEYYCRQVGGERANSGEATSDNLAAELDKILIDAAYHQTMCTYLAADKTTVRAGWRALKIWRILL